MNGWKVATILLAIIFIVETLYLGFVLNSFTSYREMVGEVQNERTECSVEICGDYEAFSYDPNEYLCSCYNGEEIAKQEVLI